MTCLAIFISFYMCFRFQRTFDFVYFISLSFRSINLCIYIYLLLIKFLLLLLLLFAHMLTFWCEFHVDDLLCSLYALGLDMSQMHLKEEWNVSRKGRRFVFPLRLLRVFGQCWICFFCPLYMILPCAWRCCHFCIYFVQFWDYEIRKGPFLGGSETSVSRLCGIDCNCGNGFLEEFGKSNIITFVFISSFLHNYKQYLLQAIFLSTVVASFMSLCAAFFCFGPQTRK